MAKEEFEIEISPTGKVTVRTIGIKGPQCVEATKQFVQLLGLEETRELTSEYHEAEVNTYEQNTVHEHWRQD